MKKIIIIFIVIFCSLQLYSQQIGINPFVGYIYNHSNRADYHTGLLNDNYNFSPLIGLNLMYRNDNVTFNFGFNTTELVNEFNLRGNPVFYLTKDNYITKFRTYNLSLSIEKKLLHQGIYSLSLESGFDYSYVYRNNYPNHSETTDSIFYKKNNAQIIYIEGKNYLIESTFGLFLSINNEFKLNEALSLNLKLSGRFGFRQKFQSDIVYIIDDDDTNLHYEPTTAYMMNKGDYFGINLGLVYYVSLKKSSDKNKEIRKHNTKKGKK
jgi:hypothetical protein